MLGGDRLASLLNFDSTPPVLSSIVLPTLYTAQQLLLAGGWLTLSGCLLRQEIEYSHSLQTIAALITVQKPNVSINVSQAAKPSHDSRNCARDIAVHPADIMPQVNINSV
jgi:hypothetical protein